VNHPAVVRNILDQLLAGWMSEIRAEFGAEVEAEVRLIADVM